MKRIMHRAAGALAALLLGLGVAAPAVAQSGSAGEGQDVQALEQELQAIQQELAEIRNAAMENNPELRDRQASLQSEVMTRMRDEGVNPEQDIRRLQDIATELRSGELSESEQQELAQEYRETRQELLEARRTVLDAESVQDSQAAFREDLITAMEAENPDVRELIDDFERLREELRSRSPSRGQGGAQAPVQ